MVSARIVVLTLALPVFAGCASEVSTEGSLDSVKAFEGFTWEEPRSLGSSVTFSEPGTAPRYVQQLTPLTAVTVVGATESPPVAVDEEGSIYTITLDAVLKSTDDGANWTVVLDFRTLSDPSLQDRRIASEVALWMDGPSQTLYAAFAVAPDGCQALFASGDHGVTWEARVPNGWPASCYDSRDLPLTLSKDHFIVTAPHTGPLDMVPRGAPHTLYWCEVPRLERIGPKCSTSWDGGATFVHEALIAPSLEQKCYPFSTGKPAVRSDGAVAVPLGPQTGMFVWPSTAPGCTSFIVSYSTDGGLSWEDVPMPDGVDNWGKTPSLAFSPDGTAYLAFRNDKSKIQVLRSDDLFESWSGPFDVTLPEHTLSDHPAVTVGDDGRVAVAYLASTTHQDKGDEDGENPATPETANGGTVWHFFVATSLDGAASEPSWYVQQVTPREDPIHMGCIDDKPEGGYFGYSCFNMGQFTDFVTGPDGRGYAARIDGCTPRNGCSADPQGGYAYRDRQAMVAVLDGGTSLYEKHGILESLGLVHPAPKRDDHEVYRDS